MQYLSLYTPKTPPSGPPSAEHMAAMGALMQKMFASGNLVTTGGLGMSATGGLRVTRSDGIISVQNGPYQSLLQQAAGWALLKADSKEELRRVIEEFLAVAGDGECDIIQLMEMPPRA